MRTTRRRFLVRAGTALAAAVAFFTDARLLWRTRAAAAQVGWSLRRATYDDVADLRDIFNSQRDAGLFPYTDLIAPWTENKAADVLGTYTGTRLLSLGGTPVGFVAFIDYTLPETKSAIVPEADPEVAVLAVCVDQLTHEQRVVAVKRLAVAVSRDLRRQGFDRCEATIHARTGFQDLFTDHIEEKRVERRAGVPEAKAVRFDLAGIVDDLGAEGL